MKASTPPEAAVTKRAKAAAVPQDQVKFASHLNESDAVLWSIERDPCLRTTVLAVSLLDSSPDWDRFHARMVEAAQQVSRLRQKVVATPLRLGPPRWEIDDRFDIDYHLRRVAVPPPRDFRAVLDLAAPMVMAAFDKDRPLWEFTLVEGLVGGQAALIFKLHHSFTDGVGAMKLARLLFDDERDPPSRRAPKKPAEPAHVGTVEAVVDSITANARTAAVASIRGAKVLPRLTTMAITHPMEFIGGAVRGARSVGKLLAPVTRPLSPIMRERGMSRRLETFDVSLGSALAAAHAVEGTLNDAFLAGVTGGMRRYHERHGAAVDELRVTMPINVRNSDDPLGNNRFTPARFALPISIPGAEERMRQLGALARNWRREPALPLSETIAGAFNRLPLVATTAIFGSLLKAIDFVATNIPGFAHRVYLSGAEVLREYAFPPTSGSACGIALLSHGEQCCVGLTIDTSAVPDPDVFTACLQEGFQEVLQVGER